MIPGAGGPHDDGSGGDGVGPRADDGAGDGADAIAEHVEVRRVRKPATPFGDTPIAGPPRRESDADAGEEDGPAETEDLAAWVRHAALVAALRSGAQACVAGVFMGIVLGFFLSGLAPGLALLLGLTLCIGAFPVSVLAGFTTYRQTLESERLRQGLCPRCGYDLRGLNTARCPECGAKLRPPRAWLADSDRTTDEE